MTQLLYKYFEAFSNKNLEGLAELFDESVMLQDWNITSFGKEKVLQANKEIFSNVGRINARPVRIIGPSITSNLVIYAVELLITIDPIDDQGSQEHLSVVDIIEILNEKIYGIKAYKK